MHLKAIVPGLDILQPAVGLVAGVLDWELARKVSDPGIRKVLINSDEHLVW